MIIIDETEELVIENEYEFVYIRDKLTNAILLEDWFYGNPDCGLIDINNKWAIIGGEHLTIWTPEWSKEIIDDELNWIHDTRLKSLK